MFSQKKDKLSGKAMFVLECHALGTKHSNYFNCLLALDWEATTLKYSHSEDPQCL